MLTVGDTFPSFDLTAVKPGTPQAPSEAFAQVTDKSYPGQWLVVFFWPKDFTFVCPTEIIAFSDRSDEFRAIGCEVS